MCPPHVLELKGGVWKEAVISSDWSWSVVGWSSVHHVGVVSIVGKESSLELVEAESSISVCVVSLYEEINLLRGWEHVDSIQTRSELIRIDMSVSWDIKDIKSISEIEVMPLSEGNLSSLNLLLLVAEVLESMNKFILIIDSENWLPAWRKS